MHRCRRAKAKACRQSKRMLSNEASQAAYFYARLHESIMGPKTLTLIDRKLSRIQMEYEWRLALVLEESLHILKPDRKASIGESYEHYKKATANALSDHVKKVHAEIISIIEQSKNSLSEEGKTQIMQLLPKYVSDELYIDRYQAFEGAVVRQFGRWGMKLDLTVYRTDLVKSLYLVGSANVIRQAIDKLADDLELVIQRRPTLLSSAPQFQESKLEQVNHLFKLEPNIFGIGLNLNYLIRRWFGKKSDP